MEALFLAHPDHRARVRAIGRPLQRHLVHDCRAIDQPADRANVGPGQRRIIEDGRIFGFARVQRLDHLLSGGAERLRRAIEVETVPGLILDLGEQDYLAAQRRRARDPIALGQHADDLAMRVLRDLPRQRAAIGFGHPVLGLDELVRRDPRLERLEELGVLEILDLRRVLKLGRIHERDVAFALLRFKWLRVSPFRRPPRGRPARKRPRACAEPWSAR